MQVGDTRRLMISWGARRFLAGGRVAAPLQQMATRTSPLAPLHSYSLLALFRDCTSNGVNVSAPVSLMGYDVENALTTFGEM